MFINFRFLYSFLLPLSSAIFFLLPLSISISLYFYLSHSLSLSSTSFKVPLLDSPWEEGMEVKQAVVLVHQSREAQVKGLPTLPCHHIDHRLTYTPKILLILAFSHTLTLSPFLQHTLPSPLSHTRTFTRTFTRTDS